MMYSCSHPLLLACTIILSSLLLTGFLVEADGKGDKALDPPTHLEVPSWPPGTYRTQNSVTVRWFGPVSANTYVITVYLVVYDETILHEEIENVKSTTYTIGDLDPGSTYEIEIKAARREKGITVYSENSEPIRVKTIDKCDGMMVFSHCYGGCIPTCDIRIPVCRRICSPGCVCPSGTYLNGTQCLTKLECEERGSTIIEVLEKPRNLTAHKLKNNTAVLITWLPVKGADYYTITISLHDGTVVKRIENLRSAFALVPDLIPGVPYKATVTAKWLKFTKKDGVRRKLAFILKPIIKSITNSTAKVEWFPSDGVIEYKVAVYNKEATELLGLFKNLTVTYVTIQGLDPGTSYQISVIVISPDSESESEKSLFTTEGAESQDALDEAEIDIIIPVTTKTPAPISTPAPIPSCSDRRRGAEAYYKTHPGVTNGPTLVECEPSGDYKPKQCSKNRCNCVDIKTGEAKPGSSFKISSLYALDCNYYGSFPNKPSTVKVFVQNTTAIKVRWPRVTDAESYIVKVYSAYQGNLYTSQSGLTRPVTNIGGLRPGYAYIVSVIAVNSQGWTSTDNVKGTFVVMPFLDPPIFLKVEQIPQQRLKISWGKNHAAQHYYVAIYKNGESNPSAEYNNITSNELTIPVQMDMDYNIQVKATAVTRIPGSGRDSFVSSNPIGIIKRPTCIVPPMDILFVIDVSAKMTKANFDKSKILFLDLIKGMTPIVKKISRPFGTRVAVVKAWENTRTVFRYDRYDDESNLMGSIKYIQQVASGTLNIGRMMQSVYTNFFSSNNNDDQRSVATAVVAFIGGRSNDAIPQASSLRGVTTVIAVGVKGDANESELKDMASRSDGVVLVPSYDDMNVAYQKVMRLLCAIK